MKKTLMGIIGGVALLGTACSTSTSKWDLRFSVPSVSMYKTTAHQLSGEEVNKYTGFFSYFERNGVKLKKMNPIIIFKEKITKVPPTNPNIKSFNKMELFASGFYNSKDHSLEDKTGLFSSQGAIFETKESADAFNGELQNSQIFKTYCNVVLQKGKTVTGVVMYNQTKPTKEFWELVDFVKSNGFNDKVSEFCYK